MFLICVMNGASYPQTVSYYFWGENINWNFKDYQCFLIMLPEEEKKGQNTSERLKKKRKKKEEQNQRSLSGALCLPLPSRGTFIQSQ